MGREAVRGLPNSCLQYPCARLHVAHALHASLTNIGASMLQPASVPSLPACSTSHLQFCTDAHEQQFAAYHAAHLQTTDGGWNTQSAGLLPFRGLHIIWRGPGLSWSTALPPILQAWPSSPASASFGEGHPGRRPVLHPSERFAVQLLHNSTFGLSLGLLFFFVSCSLQALLTAFSSQPGLGQPRWRSLPTCLALLPGLLLASKRTSSWCVRKGMGRACGVMGRTLAVCQKHSGPPQS